MDMREIKFRAWYGNYMDVFEIGEMFGWTNRRKVARGLTAYPLMQYTGLKDKNSKEIYEGDVVAKSVPLFQPLGRGQRVDEVVWGRDDKNTGMWELRLISDDRIKRNPESKVPYFEPFGLGCEPHNFEVIGNIYENPELLVD